MTDTAEEPDVVVEQIRRFHEQTGVGVLDLIFQGRGAEGVAKSIRLFGEHVLPHIRDIGATPASRQPVESIG